MCFYPGFVSLSLSLFLSPSLSSISLGYWVRGLFAEKYVYIFPFVSRFKLLAVLHKQPHLDIRRIYGFR